MRNVDIDVVLNAIQHTCRIPSLKRENMGTARRILHRGSHRRAVGCSHQSIVDIRLYRGDGLWVLTDLGHDGEGIVDIRIKYRDDGVQAVEPRRTNFRTLRRAIKPGIRVSRTNEAASVENIPLAIPGNK